MSHVLFVVPFGMEASLRFVRAALSLPGLTLGLLTQDPPERLEPELRARLAGFERVDDALDAEQLERGARAVARRWGGRLDRLVGILEPLQVPLAQARERLGLTGMGVEAARNFRDKGRMKELLRAHDLPCARHGVARDAGRALAVAEECGYPLVVKPPDGAGARGTFRVERREQLEGYLRAQPPSADAPILLEEFVLGREHSFDSASVGGRHLFHSISHYRPSPLEVLETPWIQWCVVLPREIEGPAYADIHDAGRRALDVLGMDTGLTHMEWFRRPDGSLAISEVAARPPGAQFTTLLSAAHDHDFYRAWARLMAFGEFEPPERRFAAGAVYLRGQGRGRVARVHGVEQARRELGELVVDARLPRPGQAAAGTYEGDGYVVVRHPRTEVVERALDRVLELVRVELVE